MKKAPSWLALVSIFVVGAVLTISLVDNSEAEQLTDGSTNPEGREEWWSQVNGPPPTKEQLEQTYASIEKQLRARDNSLYRDAGITEWEESRAKEYRWAHQGYGDQP